MINDPAPGTCRADIWGLILYIYSVQNVLLLSFDLSVIDEFSGETHGISYWHPNGTETIKVETSNGQSTEIQTIFFYSSSAAIDWMLRPSNKLCGLSKRFCRVDMN